MTDALESHSESAGNTKSADTKKARKPQAVQCYRWQFTLSYNGEPTEPEILAQTLKGFCKEFYYQLEEGNEKTTYLVMVNGKETYETRRYWHFQGCLSLIQKHRLNEVKNIMGRNDVHLEPAKNWHALKNYNTKRDTTYRAGPWDHKTVWVKLITELYDWQKEVVDMISKPPESDRHVYWIWDRVGSKGKTALCKLLCCNYGAYLIDGGSKDIAFSLPDNPKVVIMNITRTTEGRVNYKALEAVKDGLIFSPKYESRVKIFDSPHVLVFANFEPDMDSMSKDRWKIKFIS